MDDSEISELALRLEEAANDGYTFVGMDENHLVTNRAGFLRCAALFLRAAVAPYSKEDSFIVDVDPKQMMIEDTDVFFSWFERREGFDVEGVQPKLSLKERSEIFLGITLSLLALVCLVMGAGTLVLSLIHILRSLFP